MKRASVPIAMQTTPPAIMFYTGQWALFRPKNPVGLFLRSLSGTIAMYFYFLSVSLLPLANAMALVSSAPFFQTALAKPILKENVGKFRWAAVIVGFVAVLYMLQPSAASNLWGNCAAIVSALFAALAMLMISKIGNSENPLTIVFYFALFGSIVSLGLMPFFWHTPTLTSLFFLLMTGLFGSLAQIFQTYAYANSPSAYVSSLSYFGIVLGALSDWVFWGKVIETHIAIGSVVIIASGLYILHREIVKKRETPPPCLD
jgi:drug/metabolite transporter (DMT)-like permease